MILNVLCAYNFNIQCFIFLKLCGNFFRCFAYDAKEIRVGEVPSGVVGQPVEFESEPSISILRYS